MLATIYAKLAVNINVDDLREIFLKEYADEFFIRIMPSGVCPETRNVSYTNFADISVFIDSHTNRVVVLSAIDNLGKGASLQAVQSLNLMAGYPETTGLLIGGGSI